MKQKSIEVFLPGPSGRLEAKYYKNTKCITHNLWDNLENHINSFFEKINLEDLVEKKI